MNQHDASRHETNKHGPAEALVAQLRGSINTLEHTTTELIALLSELRSGTSIDFVNVYSKLGVLESTQQDLRARLNQVAEMAGCALPSWGNSAELLQEIERLAERARDRWICQRGRDWADTLASQLQRAEIVHPATRLRTVIGEMRDECCGQLRSLSTDEVRLFADWDAPSAWWNRLVHSSDEALVQTATMLRSSVPCLADLLFEFQRVRLVDETSSDGDKSSEMSAGSADEDDSQVVEPVIDRSDPAVELPPRDGQRARRQHFEETAASNETDSATDDLAQPAHHQETSYASVVDPSDNDSPNGDHALQIGKEIRIEASPYTIGKIAVALVDRKCNDETKPNTSGDDTSQWYATTVLDVESKPSPQSTPLVVTPPLAVGTAGALAAESGSRFATANRGAAALSSPLEKLHAQLGEQFDRLAQSRRTSGNLVYFVEHGLSHEAFSHVPSLLREGLQRHSLESPWWLTRYLPVLAYASELGYRYSGTGTEYWPMFTRATSYDFHHSARQALSDLFDRAAEVYQGCRPPATDWARAFCHIAWPITHAILPFDLRLPFAQTLRQLGMRVDMVDDDELFARLQFIKPEVGSRRFESWLQNRTLAVGLAREFLGGSRRAGQDLLSPEIRDRLLRDLVTDEAAWSELRRARQNQLNLTPKRLRQQPRRALDLQAPKQTPVLLGRLFISNRGQAWELAGELPELPHALRQAIAVPLRARRWLPTPFGLKNVNPLPRQALVQQASFPFSAGILRQATSERPFLQGFERLGLSDEQQAILASIRFSLQAPLLFRPLEDGVGYQWHAGRIPQSGEALALVPSDYVPTPPHLTTIAQISGGRIVKVELAAVSDRQWLGLTTLEQAADTSWSWLFPPALPIDTLWPVYRASELRTLWLRSGQGMRLVVYEQDKLLEESTLETGQILMLPATPGRYRTVLKRGDEQIDQQDFEVVTDLTEGTAAPCQVVLHCANRVAKALTQQQLALEINAPRPLSQVPVRVAIKDTEAVVERLVETLPVRFGPQDSLWSELLQPLGVGRFGGGKELTLVVEVGRLVRHTWQFAAESEEIWWEYPPNADPRPATDAMELNTVCRPLANMFDNPRSGVDELPRLMIPQYPDGRLAHFDGLLLTEIETHWPGRIFPPARLLRQVHDQPYGIGLHRLVEIYLQLSGAHALSLVGELHRRNHANALRGWILEASCGKSWTERWSALAEIERADPVQHLWEVALRTGAGFPVKPQDRPQGHESVQMFEAVRENLSAILPERWWAGPIPELTATDAERLDAVFQQIQDRRDFYTDFERWETTLIQTCQHLNGGRLADLLTPPSGGDELLEMPLLELELQEVADQLDGWQRRHLRGSPQRLEWSSDTLFTWLALLVQPAALRHRAWEQILPGVLADRSVARAGAFLAWRIEQLERLSATEQNYQVSTP